MVVISLTPGPDMAFFLGRAVTRGRAAGLAALFGAISGILVHTTLVALGLSALIVAAPTAFLALKTAGALYLAWLAVQAVRHGSALALPEQPPAPASLAGTWASGLAINLLNPKIVLFFMTFLPQFVRAGDPHAAAQLVVLGLLFIAVALAITVPMVFAAERVTGALRRRPRIGRALDWLFASVFAAFAAQLLLGRSR
ncbi:MAG TPA: LysE family translocator [Amaricoccus sp.]|uniref:LysE family translocator n=1 Tax=Amaricoccus sp. TaxID=1872485 RepID=UPI002C1ADB60|nr:LysE family translocator [Amaricoccus sp.]HRO10164.1 LysE family translocator [Amaricoccus sp.]